MYLWQSHYLTACWGKHFLPRLLSKSAPPGPSPVSPEALPRRLQQHRLPDLTPPGRPQRDTPPAPAAQQGSVVPRRRGPDRHREHRPHPTTGTAEPRERASEGPVPALGCRGGTVRCGAVLRGRSAGCTGGGARGAGAEHPAHRRRLLGLAGAVYRPPSPSRPRSSRRRPPALSGGALRGGRQEADGGCPSAGSVPAPGEAPPHPPHPSAPTGGGGERRPAPSLHGGGQPGDASPAPAGHRRPPAPLAGSAAGGNAFAGRGDLHPPAPSPTAAAERAPPAPAPPHKEEARKRARTGRGTGRVGGSVPPQGGSGGGAAVTASRGRGLRAPGSFLKSRRSFFFFSPPPFPIGSARHPLSSLFRGMAAAGRPVGLGAAP